MKRVPQRTCIGCLIKKPKSKLIRLVVIEGQLVADSADKTHGRGAYLCKRGQGMSQICLKLAKEKNAFKKAFKEKISQTRPASFSSQGGSD